MNEMHLQYFEYLVYFMASRNDLLAVIPWYHSGLIHQYCQMHLLFSVYVVM